MRHAIATAASGARLVAAILLALGGLRFALGAVIAAVETTTPELRPVQAPTEHLPLRAPDAAPSAPPAPSGQPVRPALSVSAGPARSDVFVNGVQVGKTPFLGEVSCRTGSPVRVEVVPARGAPLTFARPCASGNIVIGQ